MIIDCDTFYLQRFTAQDFVLFVNGERAGLVRVGTGLECEIGFEVAPQYRGKGIATAAVQKVTEMILEAGVVKRIVAKVEVGNAASVRVLEKCGYVLKGQKDGKMLFARCA